MKRTLAIIIVALAAAGVAQTAAAEVQPFLVNDTANTRQGLLDCTGFDGYTQPLDSGNFGTARTSDVEAAFFVAEDFVDGAGAVMPFVGGSSGLKWWGINYDFVATFCTDDDLAGTPFNITFYDGDATGPASVVASVTGVVPTITDTGIPFSTTTIGEYTATYAGFDVSGATWVSIQRQEGVTGCFWLWADETLAGSYDDAAYQDGGSPPNVPSDQPMCMQFYDPTQPTPTPSGAAVPVPSMNTYGIVAMVLLLIGVAVLVMWRRS